MEKLRVLKYGALFVLCLLFTGLGCEVGPEPPDPGWAKVNFINGLEYSSGKKFTAKFACDEVTFESYTGQLSACKGVTEFCSCDLYFDGDYVGYFRGCIDIADYCSGDATLILGKDGSDIALFYKCVNRCGESITKVSDILEPDDILDSFLMEDIQEELDVYLEDY